MSERTVVIDLTSSEDDAPNSNNINDNSNALPPKVPTSVTAEAVATATSTAVAAAASDAEEPKETPRKKRPRTYLAWEEMYERLVSYKAQFGSTHVPKNCKHDRRLARWVNMQRQRCRIPSRVGLLNDIGFEWRVERHPPSRWTNMYERLEQYKKIHKTTKVPFRCTEDPQLGSWVDRQRQFCKQKDKIYLLDAIGFAWEAYPKPPLSLPLPSMVWMESRKDER